jgi:hypothetical protein
VSNHRQNIAKLESLKHASEEAMHRLNNYVKETFTEGYAVVWNRNGHLQQGLVEMVLGEWSGYHPASLRVKNIRTGKTVDISLFDLLDGDYTHQREIEKRRDAELAKEEPE